VVDHVISVSGAEASDVGVEIDASTSAAPTEGDPVLLERLVQNLVENGIRHNTPGGGRVRVWAGTWPDGRVGVTVSNTGPVVPAYEIPSLFQPFRRLAGDRISTSRGAGLGLSIARAVAHAHGGEVTAVPAEGGGLVVTVVLPGVRQPAPV
jgi:signal transduction histidine kinase